MREERRWWLIGALGRFVLGLWVRSCRIRVVGAEQYEKLREEKKPVILLAWHGRMLLVPYLFRKRGIAALVSPSRDGEIIARIASGWGFRILRGSSSHAVVRAWVEMKKELEGGGELIIIPDGPRGPNRVLKPGCLKLAAETGAFLIPFSFSASRKRFLKSWDHFLLFYPFCRLVALFGRPIPVAAGLDEEAMEKERQKVEEILNQLNSSADRHFEKR